MKLIERDLIQQLRKQLNGQLQEEVFDHLGLDLDWRVYTQLAQPLFRQTRWQLYNRVLGQLQQ
jgi:hypothetical protein